MSVQEAAPGGPSEGELWWASGTNDGVLRVYYDDGVDAMWVDASPQLPGAQGIQGIQGPIGDDGIPYVYSTTTADADPGNGILRLNNVTFSSATLIYIDDLDDDGTNIETEILNWDDVTNAVSRGRLILKRVSDGSKVVFDITGASVDATGYVKLAVTYSDGATSFTDTDAIVVQFAYSGNDGAISSFSGDIDMGGNGLTEELTAAVSLVDGDLCYLNSSGKMDKTDADAETTADTLIGMCIDTISADSIGTFLLYGTWTTTSLTTGSVYYVSTTTAAITTTAPSATGDIVRIVGYALSTTKLFVNPDGTYVEIA